jgi:hypothetical protein
MSMRRDGKAALKGIPARLHSSLLVGSGRTLARGAWPTVFTYDHISTECTAGKGANDTAASVALG